MRKYHITQKALKRYHSYNPNYFPLKALATLFQEISPYFNLWFSAEIVTALYEGRSRESLITLVAVTLLGNLLIRTVGALINRTVDTQLEILQNNEAAAFNRKTLSLDYNKLENPEIRQHRRKILENAQINYYGVQSMRRSVEGLMKILMNVAFSILLFAEMLSLIMKAGLQWIRLGLFLVLLLCMVLNIVQNFWYVGKAFVLWKEVGDCMLEYNRMGSGYNVLGMDNRIYLQQKIISGFYDKFHLKNLEVHSKACAKSTIY